MAKISFCPQGHWFATGALFCPECGTRVTDGKASVWRRFRLWLAGGISLAGVTAIGAALRIAIVGSSSPAAALPPDPTWTTFDQKFAATCHTSAGGNDRYCSCVLNGIHSQYTIEEFNRAELPPGGGLPPKMDRILTSCPQ